MKKNLENCKNKIDLYFLKNLKINNLQINININFDQIKKGNLGI